MATLDSTYDNIPDPANVPIMPTALRYGGICALILIVLGLAFSLTGLSDPANKDAPGNLISSILNYAIMIAAVVMAIKKHRDVDLGGFIGYGRSLGVGTLTGLVIGAISAVWTYIYFTMIEPGLVETIRQMAYEEALAKGSTEEQMEQAKGIMDFFTSPAFFSTAVFFGSILIGFVVSLIAGAILKREKPMF